MQTNIEPIAICGMSCRLPGGVDSASSFWRMLVEKRTGQTPRVPASRFNIDAHYHEDRDRPGSFNVAGGYFLDGSPDDFDPGLFNMTPIEAQWLDPQQRRMLEVSYECLESAGLTLDDVAGSNTAVFVGSFTSDYQQMSTREPDFRHNYAATGVDPGIISNRIGNIFNLNGPSFTINTACSSSIYALHNACHALRARDCESAIVGGVNLILTVDQHMNTAKLGILSPTSTCHTLDASADGYGRAEGAGALYVKRLSDAIRDGDPVRGVIRSTAVNTNGKVDGMGITHPSGKGQESVVRLAYDKAGLDPRLTAYAELHGTGTPVGDPIEVRAISRALNDERSKEKPLLIGAVKPNIGHSEAASGVFAVMKAALMTEAAVIPGVALFKRLNPEILEQDWNVKVHADTAPWPQDTGLRRASVSSFGYGGTNGHVIVESVESLYPFYQHGQRKSDARYDHSSKRPLLLCFSAHGQSTLSRNIQAIGAVAADYYTADLAHTLNLHRTKLSHRAFTIARAGLKTEAFSSDALIKGVLPKRRGGIGFIFTGQGAQWAGMGRVALAEFPAFRDVIAKLDQILERLDPKATFSLTSMLMDQSKKNACGVNDAEVAQPLCTAIQIALVDLFHQWGIVPSVSIGHSSGEIGAAYAAGFISAAEAIVIAFCRGRAACTSGPGSMLAVGLGAKDVSRLFSPETDNVYIACENSPGSVTLSGDAQAISKLACQLKAKCIFAQELSTGRAYHSPYMATVGDTYDAMLPQGLAVLTNDDLAWRHPRSQMISSVTGEALTGDSITPDYWSTNLRERVLFDTAVRRMGSDKEFDQVTSIIEVGCHSALSRAFKQIGLENKTYIPSLVREKDDTGQLLAVAGSLFLAGYPVDLAAVNSDSAQEHNMARKPRTPYLLVDLPPYQWNYEKRHWAEPRASLELRNRAYPRHDLLGSRVAGLSNSCKVWRNVLRLRDVPWLRDHNLGGAAVFPAAGYLSVAIEALRQVHEIEGLPFEGVTHRDVDIKTALVVPDGDGIEVVVCLHTADGSDWHTYSVESLDCGQWTLHCEGKISATHAPITSRSHPVDETALTQRATGKRWYKAFHRVGFNYTSTFQRLQDVRTERSLHHAAGGVIVTQRSGVMQGESRYMIHPSTIDACLQLIIISIHAGKHKEMPWGVVPTHIDKVSMFFPEGENVVAGHAIAWTDKLEDRRFNTHTVLRGPGDNLLMDIEDLTCVSYEAVLPAQARDLADPEPFSVTTWKADITALRTDTCSDPPMQLGSLAHIVELISHQNPVKSALICGLDWEVVDSVMRTLPGTCAVTLGLTEDRRGSLSGSKSDRVASSVLELSPQDLLGDLTDRVYDLLVVNLLYLGSSFPKIASSTLMPFVSGGGWLVGARHDFSSLSGSAIGFGEHFALVNTEPVLTNGTSGHTESITILSSSSASPHNRSLADTLSGYGKSLALRSLDDFSPEADPFFVIDDAAGTFLLSLNESTFASLKSVLSASVPVLWLTQGVNEGRAPQGGMAEGFLRVIRSEQASARVVLLDVSHDEKPEDIARAVVEKLASAAPRGSGHDSEFWLHHGVLHVPRLYPRGDLNRMWNEWERSSDGSPKLLSAGAPIASGSAAGEMGTRHGGLAADEVEVQVNASEARAISGSHILVYGSIVRVGLAVDDSVIGKRVVAFARGSGTVARTSVYAVVNDMTAFEAPETLLAALAGLQPLVHAYQLSGKTWASSQVLSLAGASKRTTAILVSLARALGFELSIIAETAGQQQDDASRFSLDKTKVLLSSDSEALLASLDGIAQGSSLSVIAHDFTPLAQAIWSNIPAGSKFLLVTSSPSMPQALDCQPFMRGASFMPVNTNALSLASATVVLRESLALINRHPDLLRAGGSDPATSSEPLSEKQADTPERQDQSVSLRHQDDENQAEISPSCPTVSLSPNATYLLVGCLGGLGRSLTKWMMERGAKHFAFISRSGADKPEAARIVGDIKQVDGASATVHRADAADEEAVQGIVNSLLEERPIRGVVHAAMVLKDGMFEQMDHASFTAVITPKVMGALSLHKALGNLDLDFFIMTSSVSAVLGNTGQSNYSAANSFLDALARHRTTNGLAATSLALPMVLDVGVVAEDDALELSLLRKGLYGISEHEMLRGFEVAMAKSRPALVPSAPAYMESSLSNGLASSMDTQLVMGMETQELRRVITSIAADNADLYWYRDARLVHVRAALESGNPVSTTIDANADSLTTTLDAARAAGGPEAAVAAIALHIARRMSGILMIPVDDFELDGDGGPSLGSYGLDSMVGAEMRSWLFKEFALDIPFQQLLARTMTFGKLARVVAGRMGIWAEAGQS